MTSKFLKTTYLRMRGREETHISCRQGVPTRDLPSKCDDCAMREEDQPLVCAKCGMPIPDGRAQAWIGGAPHCSECVRDLLDIPQGDDVL